MVAGAGINASSPNQLHIDTAAMVNTLFAGEAWVIANNTGNECKADLRTQQLNINGTTRRRLGFGLEDMDGGAGFDINTTNIALNKIVYVRIICFVP